MNYRFSGHETFPCRYSWLPKAVFAVNEDPESFSDDPRAMVQLGVGKNMVRAIRFWAQASGMINFHRQDGIRQSGYSVTPLGAAILGPGGFDSYLENVQTLWLIHWKLSTHVEEPLFAWDYLLNRWHQPEFDRSIVLDKFRLESLRLDRELSDVTLQQHFDIFLHTYVPTRGQKGAILEDNLDCPLVELTLIEPVGVRRAAESGHTEQIFTFRREPKIEISAPLFAYCLQDFWVERHAFELTLPFREVAFGHGSPGQVFKMPEWEVRERLETIHDDSEGLFNYQESAAIQQITRVTRSAPHLLDAVYETVATYD